MRLHSSRIPRTTQWRLGLGPDAVNLMFDCSRNDNNFYNCFVLISAGDEPLPARGADRTTQISRGNQGGRIDFILMRGGRHLPQSRIGRGVSRPGRRAVGEC